MVALSTGMPMRKRGSSPTPSDSPVITTVKVAIPIGNPASRWMVESHVRAEASPAGNRRRSLAWKPSPVVAAGDAIELLNMAQG